MGTMNIAETGIPNCFRITPHQIPDRRGLFYEALRTDELSAAIGFPFRVRQVNYSVSCRNTLRGIHTTAVPPGQAKLVTCVRGAALDVAVDLRVGSPTYGRFEVTRQDAGSGISVLMSDGIGHAFLALTDDTCMNYVCNEEYVPGTMIDIDARDSEIGIPWDLAGEPIMSDKDRNAPTMAEAAASGLLPTYEECLSLYAKLAGSGQ